MRAWCSLSALRRVTLRIGRTQTEDAEIAHRTCLDELFGPSAPNLQTVHAGARLQISDHVLLGRCVTFVVVELQARQALHPLTLGRSNTTTVNSSTSFSGKRRQISFASMSFASVN